MPSKRGGQPAAPLVGRAIVTARDRSGACARRLRPEDHADEPKAGGRRGQPDRPVGCWSSADALEVADPDPGREAHGRPGPARKALGKRRPFDNLATEAPDNSWMLSGVGSLPEASVNADRLQWKKALTVAPSLSSRDANLAVDQ